MTPAAGTGLPDDAGQAGSSDRETRLRALAQARWKVAATLTVCMVAVYFGFILLIAYDKALLATLITPGLTLGILLGALVIVVAWLLTWVYVWWANAHYDRALRDLGT